MKSSALPISQSLETLSAYRARHGDLQGSTSALCRWHGRQIGGVDCTLRSHPDLTASTQSGSFNQESRRQSGQQCQLQKMVAPGPGATKLAENTVARDTIDLTRLQQALRKELYLGSGCEGAGKSLAAKRLIKKMVDQFVKSADLEGVSAEHGSDRASPLLSEFTKSAEGERLYRKAVAANLVRLESFVRKAGVNINHQDPKTGDTPLMLAVRHNHWAMSGRLLEEGARATIKNHHGSHLLAMLFQKRCSEDLSASEHIDLVTKMLATQSCHQIFRKDHFDSLGDFAFSMAAYCGDVRLCKAILETFPDLVIEFKHRRIVDKTLMNVVGGSTHTSNVPALLAVIRYLMTIDHNGTCLVDMNTRTLKGETFLMQAVLNGKYSIVDRLLEYPEVRKTINEQSFSEPKWTAYTYALQKKKKDIMKLLVRHGAIEHRLPTLDQAPEAPGRGAGRCIISCVPGCHV